MKIKKYKQNMKRRQRENEKKNENHKKISRAYGTITAETLEAGSGKTT